MDKLALMRELLAKLMGDAKGRVGGQLGQKYGPKPALDLAMVAKPGPGSGDDAMSEDPSGQESQPGDDKSKLEELLSLLEG